MSHLLRIELPDIPGSLGALATALGRAGANIEAIEIVEHRSDGTAVDDVFLDLRPDLMPDVVVSAVQKLAGMRVLWVSRYAAGGNLHLDLEAIEVITNDPGRAVHHLTHLLPRTFRSHWACIAALLEGELTVEASTSNAPDLPSEAVKWVTFEDAERIEVDRSWEGWNNTEVAAAPMGAGERVVVLGRHGGPVILDSELARLQHLATLTASIQLAFEMEP
ncbi:MAG: ACT domain-containing protein [Nocardioidaceae bacterium]